MAKRNENGRSGFKAKPSHLGLKEAYSVLQRGKRNELNKWTSFGTVAGVYRYPRF